MSIFQLEDSKTFDHIKTLKIVDKTIKFKSINLEKKIFETEFKFSFKLFKQQSQLMQNSCGFKYLRIKTTESLKKLDESFKLLLESVYKVKYIPVFQKEYCFLDVIPDSKFCSVDKEGKISLLSNDNRFENIVCVACVKNFSKYKEQGWIPILVLKTCFSLPDDISESDKCIMCKEKNREDIFTPCGHFGTCGECSDKLSYCPVCRTLITRKINMLKLL